MSEIKQQWNIANADKGNSDLIAVKALSEVRESVLRVSEFYKLLPEVKNLTLLHHPVMSLDDLKKGIPQAVLEANSYRY